MFDLDLLYENECSFRCGLDSERPEDYRDYADEYADDWNDEADADSYEYGGYDD